MKKKVLLSLLAALTAGSVILCSGCSVDLTTINEEETTLSAEIETEDLSDGTLQIHSVWYQNGGDKLTSATITFSDEDGEVFTAVTDESGQLDTLTLPGNTILTCEVADSAGEVVATAEVIFKISSDYSALTIYTLTEEDNQCILEIPTDKTDIRAAIFLTEDGRLSFANLTPWDDSYDEETTEEGDETSEEGDDASTDEDASEGDDSSEGDDASADDTADETDDDAADDAADETTDDSADTTADDTADTTTDDADAE